MTRWDLALELARHARPEAWVLAGSLALRILNLTCGAALLAWPMWLLTSGERPSVARVALTLMALAAVKAAARYGEQVLGHLAAFRTQARLRIQLYDDLVPLAPAVTAERGSGDLSTLAGDAIESLEVFYAHTIGPVIAAVVVPGLAVLAGGVVGGVPAAGILAAGFVVGGVVVPMLGARISRRASIMASQARSRLAQQMTDNVAGHQEILSHQGEAWRLRLVSEVEDEVAEAVLVGGRAKAYRGMLGALWQGATMLVLLCLVPVPDVLVPLALVPGAAPALVSIERLARSLPAALTGAGRLAQVAATAPAVSSPTAPSPPPSEWSVELDGVEFRYPGSDVAVLDEVSFRVSAGGRLGIVGPSGVGKSTIVHLLTRTFDPTAGVVRIGGVSARELDLELLRRAVRVTDQRGVLLSGTVRSNLLIARPEATTAELERACHLACLDRDLATWPDALDTVVGEFGTRLSGGQAQRLGLARAVLGDPMVLVLDESTSHQDAITQAEIMRRLLTHWQGTLIVIAHREAALAGIPEVIGLSVDRVTQCPL